MSLRINAVRILEALYRLDLSDDAWLTLVADELRPLIDRDGLGVIACFYECRDPMSFAPTFVVQRDVPVALRCASELNPVFIADGMLSRSWYLGADLHGWGEIPCVRTGALYDRGAADQLSLNAFELDGQGCWFGSFQKRREALCDDRVLLLSAIGRHLAIAHRLRRRCANAQAFGLQPDAIFDVNGRLQHAEPAAQERGVVDELVGALRALESEQASSRQDPETLRTLEDHNGLVSRRWALIENIEADGKRFFAVIDNQAKKGGPKLLTRREQEVLDLAVAGRTDKGIASALNIGPGTVRVMLRNARIKLGARSRHELLTTAKAGGLGPSADGGRHGEQRAR
jgi:DNA-binding CsgD family transcriptional regulator